MSRINTLKRELTPQGFSQEIAGSPDALQNAKILCELPSDLSNKDKYIGFHGTSLEAVLHFIRTGFLKGVVANLSGASGIMNRDIFFYPIRERLSYIKNSKYFREFSEALNGAGSDYAQILSRKHGFLHALSFPMEESTEDEFFMGLTSDGELHAGNFPWIRDLLTKNLPNKEVTLEEEKDALKLFREICRTRNGIVLAIGNDLLTSGKYTLEIDPDPNPEARDSLILRAQNKIEVGIDAFTGMIPLGAFEKDFLKILRAIIDDAT